MLDLMLSNTPAGSSCGEIYAMFRPWRLHHRHPACACGDFEIVHILFWRPPDYAHSYWRRREAR
jgi:hypothetical protein